MRGSAYCGQVLLLTHVALRMHGVRIPRRLFFGFGQTRLLLLVIVLAVVLVIVLRNRRR